MNLKKLYKNLNRLILEPGKLWALFYKIGGREVLGGIFVNDDWCHFYARFLGVTDYTVRPIGKEQLLQVHKRYALKKSKVKSKA